MSVVVHDSLPFKSFLKFHLEVPVKFHPAVLQLLPSRSIPAPRISCICVHNTAGWDNVSRKCKVTLFLLTVVDTPASFFMFHLIAECLSVLFNYRCPDAW